MDVSKYMGKDFIKADELRVPRQERIVNVYPSDRYDCLVLESGDQLSLNPFSTRTLGKAYGTESDDWQGKTIELSAGTHKDSKGEEKNTVVVKPISPPSENPRPKKSLSELMSDDIREWSVIWIGSLAPSVK